MKIPASSSSLLMVLVVVVVCAVHAVRPGFKARITQGALEYANQQAIDAGAALVPTATIPDQNGNSGHTHYSLTRIRITGFTKPSGTLTIVPGTGLKWTASNAGVSVHADWQVKYKKGWVKMSTSGSVDLSAKGVGFSVVIVLGEDSAGRPSVKSSGCSCSVGGVNIDIHGKISFLANLFRGEIEKRVRAIIPGKVCDAVNQAINTNAESQLQKLQVMTPLLGKKFMLDYRLVSNPMFQSAYMETFHKGEIDWTGSPTPPPFSPQPLPPYPSSSRMLYLWVGQYVPQSFVFAAQQHGFLRYNLTTKDLSPDDRGFLNTTCTGMKCIGSLVPQVGQKYPNCSTELHMRSTAVPRVRMAPGTLQADFAGDIAFYANTPGGQTPYLLTLNVTATFNMTATIDNQLVVGNISGSSFKVAVVKSAVGKLFNKSINVLVGLTMKLFIIPKMNAAGMNGFPLPVTGDFKFNNTQLQIQQDALMVATDLQYKTHK